jgi:hypothetical protein
MSKIDAVIENLRNNNLNPQFVPTTADVIPLVASLLTENDVVAVGGSVTLEETGVIDHLRSGHYRFLDRYADGLTRDEKEDIFRRSFFADVYLTSANAITEHGELYNVDGTGNRVAAIAYGPKKVIVVAGVNKLVRDLDEAAKRVKTSAAPPNTRRLGFETFCNKVGHCVNVDDGMTRGCATDCRICCSYLVTGYQRSKDRIHVILVGEECGY